MKKKKIALIGTSPIILIIANHLRNAGHQITIFDTNKKIGGAWAYYKFENHHISTQTNVIVPDTKFEERNIPLINEFLKKKFKTKVKRNVNSFKPLGYLAKKNYDYNLNSLYEKVSQDQKIKFVKKFIKNIVIKNKKVLINKLLFDEIYITTYCGVENLIIDNSKINIKPRPIVSEHAMVIAKKITRKRLAYSENFDQNFDRAQIKKIDNYAVFTARVRKEKKGEDILKLIMKSKLVKNKSDIIKIVKTKYKNYYRNFEQRDFLSRNTIGTPINYVNSALFVESFFNINQKLNLLKRKYI